MKKETLDLLERKVKKVINHDELQNISLSLGGTTVEGEALNISLFLKNKEVFSTSLLIHCDMNLEIEHTMVMMIQLIKIQVLNKLGGK